MLQATGSGSLSGHLLSQGVAKAEQLQFYVTACLKENLCVLPSLEAHGNTKIPAGMPEQSSETLEI